ncbi:hypothetical protein GCM10022225_15890 [Plantactinospora mayteni]|uniref:Uncharacterized protein n=1 Tax=Plantactinospora mayteni TaxID=566021 RepID=A0ABQ4EG17_9ACTN|nr:hypothetical protein [Plantactinospora mayteni]GIG93663.1 hypothetical protein Pma05_02360 [Plantactinospora mayteni]
MSEIDPHIHVDRQVVQASAGLRDVMASAFGLVTDAPAVVSTGCGLEVPYAMTSARPESVTCLPCREHAHREHLHFAGRVERLSRMAGSTITSDQASQVGQRHRGLAKRFSSY